MFPNTTEPTRARRMREEISQQDDPSEAMKSPRVENARSALTGISAPRSDEKESWANTIINGAQLVSVRILRNKTQKYVTLNMKTKAYGHVLQEELRRILRLAKSWRTKKSLK